MEDESQPNSKFIPELSAPDPDSVKKYILTQPEQKRGDAYGELVKFLLPDEDRLYRQMDINDPRNLNFLSLGLQRKQNLEAILNKKKVSDNLTTIIDQLPPEVLSQPNNDELSSFLSPLEQKVLSGASKNESKDSDDFLIKKSLLAIAHNRRKQKEYEASKEAITPKFYPELAPPNPDLVKQYVLAQPERDAAYKELVSLLLPEEDLLYHQMDVNDPKNLDLLSSALQRKQNLEAILNKKKVSDNLTAIFKLLPSETLSQLNNEEFMSFLSPLEQKVLSGASKNESENVDNFLVKQSLLAIAYNRMKQKEGTTPQK
jgi:hypothetical protein